MQTGFSLEGTSGLMPRTTGTELGPVIGPARRVSRRAASCGGRSPDATGRWAWRRGAAGQPTPRRNATSGPASTRRSCGQALPRPKCSAPPEAAPNTQICTAQLVMHNRGPIRAIRRVSARLSGDLPAISRSQQSKLRAQCTVSQLCISACRTKPSWSTGSGILECDAGCELWFRAILGPGRGDRPLTVIPRCGAGAASAGCVPYRPAAIRFRRRPGRAGTSWSVSGRS